MFSVVCRKDQEKLKKMSGFTEALIQGSDNLKTFALSDHDKSKMCRQTVNQGKYIKSRKHGNQCCSAPVSLTVPKNAPILKRFKKPYLN